MPNTLDEWMLFVGLELMFGGWVIVALVVDFIDGYLRRRYVERLLHHR